MIRSRLRAVYAGFIVMLLVAAGAVATDRWVAVAATTCDRNATPSTLAADVSAVSAGQTICLASGDYGTWGGTSKAITVRAADGAAPRMRINFGAGDSGFVLDGMTGMGGSILTGASDITVRNSTFTSPLQITVTNADILVDSSHFDWNAVYDGGTNAKIRIDNSGGQYSGVTISNSTIRNGDLDGIHLGAGFNAIGNEFSNLCDVGTNHTDNIQYEGGTGGRIAGNYVVAGSGCTTQGITSYDGGTNGLTIEDNVVDIRRPWGIELYSDRNSIVRHNTLRWYADSQCEYGGIECGQIGISRKSADPAGSGTQVYDNIAALSITNGSTVARNDHNVNGSGVTFVGPLNTYAGFRLATGSTGRSGASDGLDLGARISSSPPTVPTPTPTPSATPSPTPSATPGPDTAADAIWTVPTGAWVGTAVTLDGTRSKGNGTLSCTWSFEDEAGSTVWETQTGCRVEKTFRVAGTKYVELTVRDADGDTDSSKQSFVVSSQAAPTPTATSTPASDVAADAIWTVPTGARVGTAVTLDATRSKGNGTLSCTWSFEDEAGSTVWETQTGCRLEKTFRVAGTKYVELTVRDADGDTDSSRQSFVVSP